MKNRAVIEADFATFRPVAGRKVLQLVFEIPIENAEKAMGILGYPVTGSNIWCAIARLDLKAAQANEVSGSPETSSSKPKRKFEELPYSQQAALRCNDSWFQEFAVSEGWNQDHPIEVWVRMRCKVGSRAEITQGSEQGSLWEKLEANFDAWVTTQKYGEARR